jgi:hypothetical protein
MRQWEEAKAVLYPVEVPPSQQAAFMLPQWQGNSVLIYEKLPEITRTLLLLPC